MLFRSVSQSRYKRQTKTPGSSCVSSTQNVSQRRIPWIPSHHSKVSVLAANSLAIRRLSRYRNVFPMFAGSSGPDTAVYFHFLPCTSSRSSSTKCVRLLIPNTSTWCPASASASASFTTRGLWHGCDPERMQNFFRLFSICASKKDEFRDLPQFF